MGVVVGWGLWAAANPLSNLSATGIDGRKVLQLSVDFILPMVEHQATRAIRKTKEHVVEHLESVFGQAYPKDSDYYGKDKYAEDYTHVLYEKWMRKDVDFFVDSMAPVPRWMFLTDYDPLKPFSEQVKIMEEAFVWTLMEAVVTNVAKGIKQQQASGRKSGLKLKGGGDHDAKRVWVSSKIVGMLEKNRERVMLSRARGGAKECDRALIKVRLFQVGRTPVC